MNGHGNGSSPRDELVSKGVSEKVADKFQEIFQSGKVDFAELDERAVEAIKEFSADEAIDMLEKFLDSNLDFVQNKSAYLCGHMKLYRERKTKGITVESTGPNTAKILEILNRTGYQLDVSVGQRKYGGPPPNWHGTPPLQEVFCGNIPHDVFEDELIPLFEGVSTIYELRLMTDPLKGKTRGFCFVKYTDHDAPKQAQKQLDGYEFKGQKLQVNLSTPNTRLYVGNISKTKDKEELYEEFSKHTDGLLDVITFAAEDNEKKNRGFCFLDYEDHKAASYAKKKLTRRGLIFGNSTSRIAVDWADQQEEPDDEAMSKVKTLIVKNLKPDMKEETLKEMFEHYGKVEKLNRIRSYSFVFFEERDDCMRALDALNGTDVEGNKIEVALARPPMEKDKHRDLLKKREKKRMFQQGFRRGFPPAGGRGAWGPPMPPPPFMGRGRPPMRGGPMRPPMPPHPAFMRGRGFGPRPPMGGPMGRGFAGKRKMDGAFGGMSKRGNWGSM